MNPLLFSNIIGKGKPLLILHGLFGSGDNWISLGRKWATHFEVHLIDLRNHGRSFHDDNMDYESMTDDIIAYCEHFRLHHIYLLGHSMGGKLAMHVAVHYPEKVQKLIIADIAPKKYSRKHDFIFQALQKIDFSLHNSRKIFDTVLQKDIPDIAIRQFLLKNIYRKSKESFAFRFNLSAIMDNYDNILEALPPFVQFDKKTLFIKGENSNYIQKTDTGWITAHFPLAEIKSVPRAGHWLHAENPIEFYNICDHYLTK